MTWALFTGVRNAGKLRSLAISRALQASMLEPSLLCGMKTLKFQGLVQESTGVGDFPPPPSFNVMSD